MYIGVPLFWETTRLVLMSLGRDESSPSALDLTCSEARKGSSFCGLCVYQPKSNYSYQACTDTEQDFSGNNQPVRTSEKQVSCSVDICGYGFFRSRPDTRITSSRLLPKVGAGKLRPLQWGYSRRQGPDWMPVAETAGCGVAGFFIPL